MSDTYLNGEVTALKAAREKAQETLNRLDRALAILNGAGQPTALEAPALASGATLTGRASKAVAEYHRGGRKGTEIAKRYGVSVPTVYAWLKRAGVPTRTTTRLLTK